MATHFLLFGVSLGFTHFVFMRGAMKMNADFLGVDVIATLTGIVNTIGELKNDPHPRKTTGGADCSVALGRTE